MTTYVCTTDKFMSGWGMAEGLINKLIIICNTPAEAEIVLANADARGDQKYISASYKPPSYFHKRWQSTGADYQSGNYYVQIKTRDDMPMWFTKGAF